MPQIDQAYVYILANNKRRLYTGVTTRLAHRVNDHKTSRNPNSFTSRYKINKLVYYEGFANINEAIARETQIKGWLRIKKIQLIVSLNPTWQDLSLNWGKPIEPFDESKLHAPETFQSVILNTCHAGTPSVHSEQSHFLTVILSAAKNPRILLGPPIRLQSSQ